MKKIITLIICFTIVTGAFAQEKGFSWGVKAGLNLSNVVGKDVKEANMKAGFNVGVVTEFGITDKFAVSPELVYSTQGYSMDLDKKTMKLNAQYINLPIMAKYYVIDKLSINLGPQFGYAVSMKSKIGSESVKADKDSYNAFDVAIGVGATYHFWKMFADVRYNYSFTEMFTDTKSHNSVIQLGVGYKF